MRPRDSTETGKNWQHEIPVLYDTLLNGLASFFLTVTPLSAIG